MAKPRTLLGAKVRAKRLARGWTQHELEDRAGLGSNVVSAIECGHKIGGRPTLALLERVLECKDLELVLLAERDRRRRGQ